MSLIQMSFSGAVMILVILAVRMAALNRLPKKLLFYFGSLYCCGFSSPFPFPL